MSWDVVVVLGARVLEGGRPSDALRCRVLTAAALYRDGAAPRLLFTGGPVGQPVPEAQVAAALAASHGVPPAACLVEPLATSTWENARLTAPLLRDLGARRILLVTDQAHLFRALRCFWAHAVAADGTPALRDGAPFVARRRLSAWVREAAALARRPLLLVTRPPPAG